jgi:nucleoid DNA-binding protein
MTKADLPKNVRVKAEVTQATAEKAVEAVLYDHQGSAGKR